MIVAGRAKSTSTTNRGSARGSRWGGSRCACAGRFSTHLRLRAILRRWRHSCPIVSAAFRCAALARISQCAVNGVGPQRVEVPPGSWFVPPGNNRSSGGGNEAVEAFGEEGRNGDSVSMQAVTRVNAEQASKRVMQEPTRLSFGEGRRRWNSASEQVHRSCRGIGDGMQATGTRRNTGSPSGDRRLINRQLVRARPGRVGWRRGR